MKKLFVALMFFMTSANWAAAQTQVLNIYKGVNLDYLDGTDDDEIWSKVAAVPVTRKFADEEPTVEAYFKMYYTDDFLYIYVDVKDDVHFPAWVGKADNEKIQDVHHIYDKVELYFDVNDVLKDGKSPAYLNGYMDPGHYQVAPYFEEDAYESPYLLTGLLYGDLSDQIMVCYALKSDYTSYSMEYEIPLDKFKNDKAEFMSKDKFLSLPEGLGFDLTIVDNDNDGQGRKRMVWCSNETEVYYNMDTAGVVKFVDEPATAGIINISAGRTDMPFYTLQGFKVNGRQVTPGLYVRNGKKIVVR